MPRARYTAGTPARLGAFRRLQAFRRSEDGATAVEFALVAVPFLYLILVVLQVGIYFMAKSSLDAGVIRTAEYVRQQFNSGASPVLGPVQDCSLQTYIANNSGSFVSSALLYADAKQLTTLDPAAVPVSTTCPGNTDYGAPGVGSIIVIRARYTPQSFMPGFAPTLNIYASAIVRRQVQ